MTPEIEQLKKDLALNKHEQKELDMEIAVMRRKMFKKFLSLSKNEQVKMHQLFPELNLLKKVYEKIDTFA